MQISLAVLFLAFATTYPVLGQGNSPANETLDSSKLDINVVVSQESGQITHYLDPGPPSEELKKLGGKWVPGKFSVDNYYSCRISTEEMQPKALLVSLVCVDMSFKLTTLIRGCLDFPSKEALTKNSVPAGMRVKLKDDSKSDVLFNLRCYAPKNKK